MAERAKDDEASWYGPLHGLTRTVSPFVILLAAAVIVTEPDVLSASGWVYALATLAMGIGLLRGPIKRWPRTLGEARHLIGPGTLGVVAFVAMAAWKLSERTPGAEPRLGPHDREARVLTRLFEERDAAVLGARWLAPLMAGRELGHLHASLSASYPRMTADGVALGTAILPTYIGGQDEDAFDLHVIDGRGPPRDLDVLFLHGSGGSFSLLCWQVAVSVRELGVRTLCPAMAPSGDWSSRHGRPILTAMLDRLADRRLVVVGLSAGSLSLSELGPELARERPNVVGLVLISGAARRAEPTALPTLMLHGVEDRMTPIEPARAYAERAGSARLVELPSGHFALLDDHVIVERELEAFVRARL